MNKAKLCNIVRSMYPKAFGIRKTLQRLKVERLARFSLPEEVVRLCEDNPSEMETVIAPYCEKWEAYLKPVVAEMEHILQKSTAYQNHEDMKQLRADILFCRLAYGFLPSEYVGFELEKKTPVERKQFISDIETLAFGYSVNDISELQSIVDKAKSFKKFREYFKRDAMIIQKNSSFSEFEEFVQKHPVFVKKSTNSSQGKNIDLVNIETLDVPLRDYFDRMIAKGEYLLEEKVIQHPEMAKFNSSSVNTIRCMTMKCKNEVMVPYCFMRTGRAGSFVDNGGAGGILIGVDEKTGVTNTDGFDEYMNQYACHPDTQIPFKNQQIPAWDEMIDFCKVAAAKVNGIGYLSWDMAYTEQGWVVIEVNGIGQLIGPQIVMKRGIKAEIDEYFMTMRTFV